MKMKTHFNNIQEIFYSIKNNSFNRNYAWEIADAYIYEENQNISFDEKLFEGFGFLFQFFLIEQFDIPDVDFKNIIEKTLLFQSNNLTPLEIKKILYENQLNQLLDKLNNKMISEEVYKNQVSKYLK
jgi:hypothetical protein